MLSAGVVIGALRVKTHQHIVKWIDQFKIWDIYGKVTEYLG